MCDMNCCIDGVTILSSRDTVPNCRMAVSLGSLAVDLSYQTTVTALSMHCSKIVFL